MLRNWLFFINISALLACSGSAFAENSLELKSCVASSVQSLLTLDQGKEANDSDQVVKDFTRDKRPILIVSDTHFGQRTGVVTLMENLREEVGLLTGDPNKIRFLTSADLPGLNIPGQGRRAAILSDKKFKQVLEEVKPQAVHIMVEGPLGRSMKNLLLARKIPFTTSYTTQFPEYAATAVRRVFPGLAEKTQTLVSNSMRAFHDSSDGIMVATPTLAEQLISRGFDSGKIRLWSRGVDTALFRPDAFDAKLYAEMKRPISVYTGRVVLEKNLEDFLKMSIPGTKVVIGDGTALRSLKLKYPEAVFLGRIDHQDLPKYLASADSLVFPSVTDTFGQSQLEANAAGIPVVAYKVPGPVDVVRSPDSGVLAPYDAKDPASNIRNLEKAWFAATEIRRGKPRRWAENWSWRKTSIEFLSYLQRLPRSTQSEFGEDLGSEFVEAEHRLVSRTPFFSHPTKLAGFFFPSLRFTGKLDKLYAPEADKTFDLPSVLIPRSQMAGIFQSDSLSESGKKVLLVRRDGQDYVRFFIHPAEVDRARELFEKYPADPVHWVATPTSSARSLIVRDINHDFESFFVKSSISQNMGRYKRAIDDERAVRAVKISDELERIHSETRGKIGDDGKSWDFYRESFSALPALSGTGGFIYREKPESLGDDIVIPWFSLIADRGAKPRWIDELFKASGKPTMAGFVWEDLTKPVVDLHDLLSIENGLTTELHQQNTLLRIDRRTMRVKGILLRDMDAHFVDHSLRAHRLGKPVIGYGNWQRSSYLFRYGQAQGNQFKSYVEKLRMESLQWTMKYALSKAELESLLAKADARMVGSFNRQFPDFAVPNVGAIEGAWQRLHEAVTTRSEKAAYGALAESFSPDLKSKILNALRDRSSRLRLPAPAPTP